MNRFTTPSILLLAAAFLAGAAGSVQTRDGQVHEGDVRLDDGAVVLRPAAAGGDHDERRIAWPDVARATLRADPKPDRPAGSASGELPAGWKSQDVGAVAKPGSATCDAAGAFTIKASGWGAWGPDDSGHFVYRPFDGDGQVVARVPRPEAPPVGPDPDAHVKPPPPRIPAGVMFRESLNPDAAMAYAAATPKGGAKLVRRPPQGGPTVKLSPDPDAPTWVRLTRKGDVFTAFLSRDGKQWEPVESKTVPMARGVLVGVFAATGTNVTLDPVRVDSVLVAEGAPDRTDFSEGGGGGPTAAGRGVLLTDGTFLAGPAVGATEAGVVVARGGTDRHETLARDRVARLVFNPPPPGFLAEDRPAGVLLTNGDFVDGAITSIVTRPATEANKDPGVTIGVSSLLFGIRKFDGRELTAAVLAPTTPRAGGYEVITADGSVLRAGDVVVTKDGVTADGQAVADVVEVRRANGAGGK